MPTAFPADARNRPHDSLLVFLRVRLNDSKYITEYNRFRPFHKGICVDVFPFDYVPTDVAELKAFQS